MQQLQFRIPSNLILAFWWLIQLLKAGDMMKSELGLAS